MAHRIEVELTSRTDQDTWTWRAAGAKQPRGTVDASLVPDGSAQGTVLRAEIETTLDGSTVLALLPLKTKGTRKVDTIDVIGTPQKGPDVNVVLAGKPKGRRRDERGDGDRGDRGDRGGARRPSDRGGRPDAGGAPRAPARPSGPGRGRPRAG